jgi:endonuclease/exonuclease/phosphatase family metal-dependent hydrolase
VRNLLFLAALALLGCGKKGGDFGTEGRGNVQDSTWANPNNSLITADPGRATDTLVVATLNMSVGFDVAGFLFKDMSRPEVAYGYLKEIREKYLRNLPRERVTMMAKAIIAADPDVVGLQEVMTMSWNDTPSVDFPVQLLADIKALGGPAYQMRFLRLNDTLLQGDSAGYSVKMAFSEGNATLVRPGFLIQDSADAYFKEIFSLPMLGGQATSYRAVNYVRVRSPKAVQYQFYNTHLEIDLLDDIRNNQASELKYLVDSLQRPGHAQIILGDLNSGTSEVPYLLLKNANFLDAFFEAAGTQEGTCCVANSRLRGWPAEFSNRRLDYVFARRIVGLKAAQILLKDPVETAPGDTLQASDHRMVLVRLLAQ